MKNKIAKHLTINLTASQGKVLVNQYLRVVDKWTDSKVFKIGHSFAFELQRCSCREILGEKLSKYNTEIQFLSPATVVPIRVTYIQFLWLIEVANYFGNPNENMSETLDVRASIFLAAKHADERHYTFKSVLKKEPFFSTLTAD